MRSSKKLAAACLVVAFISFESPSAHGGTSENPLVAALAYVLMGVAMVAAGGVVVTVYNGAYLARGERPSAEWVGGGYAFGAIYLIGGTALAAYPGLDGKVRAIGAGVIGLGALSLAVTAALPSRAERKPGRRAPTEDMLRLPLERPVVRLARGSAPVDKPDPPGPTLRAAGAGLNRCVLFAHDEVIDPPHERRTRKQAHASAARALGRLLKGEELSRIAEGERPCPAHWLHTDFKLQPGGVTDVRDSPFGYYLVMRQP